MAKKSNVLLPFNGQYCSIEKFAEEIERSIEAAKSYETGTAVSLDKEIKKELFKALSDYFKQKSE